MKKSTSIVLTGIAASFILLTAANLKLKQEYTLGNIRSGYDTLKLAPFHYISEDMKVDEFPKDGMVAVISQPGQPFAVSRYRGQNNGLTFRVSNDTLYIGFDSEVPDRYDVIGGTVITTPQLNALSAEKMNYQVSGIASASFSLSAKGMTTINSFAKKFDTLDIRCNGSSMINMYGSDTVYKASLIIADSSSFSFGDLVFRDKHLQLSDKAGIRLSGKTIRDFVMQK